MMPGGAMAGRLYAHERAEDARVVAVRRVVQWEKECCDNAQCRRGSTAVHRLTQELTYTEQRSAAMLQSLGVQDCAPSRDSCDCEELLYIGLGSCATLPAHLGCRARAHHRLQHAL